MQSDQFSQIIHLSFHRVEKILFQSFSAKKWLRLIWIAFLAGAFSSGGSGLNFPSSFDDKDTKTSAVESKVQDKVVTPPSEKSSAKLKNSLNSALGTVFSPQGDIKLEAVWMICAVVAFILILFIFFMWLGARFQFVWWEAIVKDSTAISEPFKRYYHEGEMLFSFYLKVFFGFLAFFALIGFIIYFCATSGVFNFPKEFMWGVLLVVFLVLIPALIIFVIAVSIFNHIVCPQIVNIMAMTQCSAGEALGKLWDIYQANVKACWLFVLINFGLGIAAGIAYLIGVVILVIVFFIFFALIGFFCALLYTKFQVLMWMVIIFIGIPIFLGFMLLVFALCLPISVFFRSMSLYFLSSLKCGYEPLPLTNE